MLISFLGLLMILFSVMFFNLCCLPNFFEKDKLFSRRYAVPENVVFFMCTTVFQNLQLHGT